MSNWAELLWDFRNRPGQGNGTPLQYSGLENPMDGGAWEAAVHGVAKSRTGLSDFTFTFHFHALEKEMAPHSSVLPRESQGQGSLVGFRLWGRTESDTTEQLSSSSMLTILCLFFYVCMCTQSCPHICSVVSSSLQPHRLSPIRLFCPWNFPGKNTGVGHHFLFQRIFQTQGLNPYLLCLLYWQMDSLPLRHLGSLFFYPFLGDDFCIRFY